MGGMEFLGAGAGALQAFTGYQAGEAAGAAGEAAALQATLDAKSAELGRRQALQDALAMQAVITGAGGRAAGEGSVLAVREADIKRAGEDVSLIKAGGKARAASARAAGYSAKSSSITGALSGLAKAGYDYSQIG